MKTGEIIKEARPPAIQQLRECAAAVCTYPLTVVRNWEIVRNFYSRELRSRFRGTILGFLWPFAQPLALFLVYYFVFAIILDAKLGGIGVPEEGQKQLFLVYLFVGVVVWSGFAESILRNASIILENANLIKKIAFPSEILPFNTALVAVTIQCMALGAYLAVSPLLGFNPWSYYLCALPVLLLLQIALSLGLSLAVAASNVFVRDTTPILGIVMTFWQFATPVFWSPENLTPEKRSKIEWALEANPMNHLLLAYRKILVFPGAPAGSQFAPGWPWEECGKASLAALIMFVLGYGFFFIAKRRFSDEL
ncbi:MAG: ABC transporter permease [Planctomycetes bacterium]|nr:ABC transporter permease [Planctomycetota bacterium]